MIRWRRLVRDYEQRIDVSQAMIMVAMGVSCYAEMLIPDFPNGLLLPRPQNLGAVNGQRPGP